MSNLFRFINEALPLTIFFITFKLYGIYYATFALTVSAIVSFTINYINTKKVPIVSLVSTTILITLSAFTYFSGNTDFVKLKPTIVNVFLAGVLTVGVLCNKGLVKYIFEGPFELTQENWIKFSKRWAIFFLFLAIMNEVIWRNCSDEMWVKFKVFATIPLTIVFILCQLPFLMKNNIKN
ncbi:MAG: septation protein IspZ [Sphingobacteriia bacterium]|nr:septation protein IspZ [Sphingobacteriia bacterium]